MENDTVQSALDSAFKIALLLGCDSTTAEATVLDGIGACEDVSHPLLLAEAVRSALRRRASSAGAPARHNCFPMSSPPFWNGALAGLLCSSNSAEPLA